MKFVSIDVETANANMASVCSIGVAVFENGELATEWYSLINPEDYFAVTNTSIHGIDEDAVIGAPSFTLVFPELDSLLCGEVVVSHTHFDRVALQQVAQKYEIEIPRYQWLDSARVARRAWPDCAKSGYGLKSLAARVGYTFEHHNALEDAKAAGQVLVAAMRETELDLQGWFARVSQPISAKTNEPIRREGNPEGALFGEVVVFTGALEIPRRVAADLAASAGCEVASGVTKKTTLLVVGDVDVSRLSGNEKTSKHLKAEALIAKGQPIRIIRETDFKRLAELA